MLIAESVNHIVQYLSFMALASIATAKVSLKRIPLSSGSIEKVPIGTGHPHSSEKKAVTIGLVQTAKLNT